MKTISLGILLLALAVPPVWAQDTATQQQLDRLSGQIQDMQEAQALQAKKLDALEKEISELRDKINTPVVDDSASRDDLKRLAEQVQEIDRKRQEDSAQISHQLEQLGTTLASPALTTPDVKIRNSVKTPSDEAVDATVAPGKYKIKTGENLGLILKHLREKGVNVSLAQLLDANPKIDPNLVVPGQVINIPDPSVK